MSRHNEKMRDLYDKKLELYENGDERGDIYKNYREQEKVIENIFSSEDIFERADETQQIQKDKTLQNVLLKVSVLDSFYSTNLTRSKFGVYKVAKHIAELESNKQIHQKIRNANPQNYNELKDIVKQIAKCNLEKTIKDKVIIINPYSFATKYCFHHNQNAFRIYDSFVREVLVFFNNGKSDKSNAKFNIPSKLVGTNFYGKKLTNKELKDYDTYNTFLQAIDEFAKHYGLENENTRDLDHFLWILGKENRIDKKETIG
ncbi:hypothetical protein [Helicobacter cinaedi]|uniref:hypothetical protein n=1 Tax=Helicobacter cinaedi TaxID=213 RepID=UPI000CF11512|nr:hypothetical protein [Helicobacter cinaedi]